MGDRDIITRLSVRKLLESGEKVYVEAWSERTNRMVLIIFCLEVYSLWNIVIKWYIKAAAFYVDDE